MTTEKKASSRAHSRTRQRAQTRKLPRAAGAPGRRWSAEVTRTSNALDLEAGVFAQRSPRAIALSLSRSAERSRRRKATPFRSAMSMLVFYLNRAGKNLTPARRRVLEDAKDELRKIYGKTRSG